MQRDRQGKSRQSSRAQRLAAAEELAAAAFGFIAADSERLGRFFALTGIGPESVRRAAREPLFLVDVLDHIAGDEPLLLAFAAESRIDPKEVMRARHTIAGGHWGRHMP
jgi:Protein of unknown function (DUF3572)